MSYIFYCFQNVIMKMPISFINSKNYFAHSAVYFAIS
jgi:hypothetical protein